MRAVMTQPDRVERILNSACTYFGLTREDLAKKRKKSPVQHHTRLLIPILYEQTNLNFKEIGAILGCQSHSNVIHHYRNVMEELSGDIPGYKKTIQTYNELTKFIDL
jgi:chromosomal replication initiation ATPase DnaA